jgi:protein SCO1/2
MRRLVMACLVALSCAAPARALTERDLATVSVRPAPGARLPLDLGAEDQTGRGTTLAAVADRRPIVFVFADYRCRYLCGPAISMTADALAHTTATPGRDYRLLVLGLDPRDTPSDMTAFGAARLSAYPRIRGETRLLISSPASISAAARALGFHYRYDPEHDQFAHPATAFVLAPDGRLVAALSELALQPETLGAALDRARSGGGGPHFIQQLSALCHAFDPTRGVYDRPVQTALRLGSLGLIAAGAGAVLWRRQRRGRV